MTEKKETHPRCVHCGTIMNRVYVRSSGEQREWLPIGWACVVCQWMSWD